MNMEQYIAASDFLSKQETDKAVLLAFYYLRREGLAQFTTKDVCNWFLALNLAGPNESRLRKRLRRDPRVVRGTDPASFRLHAKTIADLESQFPGLCEQREDVIAHGSILPESLYLNTRGYIEQLARQINASYENNIFDGCAVLMRRLLEIVLIHAYENHKLENAVKDGSGNFLPLESIIDDAKSNPTLSLSRDSKGCLDVFRKLGNFSAHKIHYNCRRSDIAPRVLEYRALIEELLYKAGIRI